MTIYDELKKRLPDEAGFALPIAEQRKKERK